MSTNILLPGQFCRRDSASTTGKLGPDSEKKMPSKNRLQAGGISLHCRRRLIDYVDHDLLTNRFHVTLYGGCAILFNKDTFYPNIDVKSIYFHDTRREVPDKVMEGCQGWVLQGVLSRASFRRPPLSGQETFTVLSLLLTYIYDKKLRIAKKLILTTISAEIITVLTRYRPIVLELI